jgi:hypothetical protein
MPRARAALRALLLICFGAANAAGTPAFAQQAAAFRFSDLDLRDPHVFISFIVCNDITDTPLVGFSVNGEIQRRNNEDADADGRLDQSYLVEFLPLDRSAPANLIAFGAAECSAPAATTSCLPVPAAAVAGDAAIGPPAACLGTLPGTVRPYVPGVAEPALPCFASPSGTLQLDLAGTPVTLRNVALSATFVGDPGDSLTTGLLRGFISEADADATTIPPGVPLVAGRSLSSLLPGGTGSCQFASEKDTLDGVPGWWFYFNFEAARVPIADPFGNGFSNGFEP